MGLKEKLKNAFAVEEPGFEFTPEHTRVADKLAGFLVKRGMTTPAIIFLKSSAPLNMIANQALIFFKPFASMVFNAEEYKIFAEMLEHRYSLEFLTTRIEEAERRRSEKHEEENTGDTGN